MAAKKGLSNEQTKIMAVSLIALAVLGIVYWIYLWSPFSKRIATAKSRLESVEHDVALAEGQVKRLPQLKEEVEALEKQTKDAERQLPKDKNLPDVIYTLMQISKRYNVDIRSFAQAGGSDKQYFSEVAYSLTATGSYNSLGKFITAVGTCERIFSVQGLTMSASSGAKGLTLNAAFTLIIYQYKGA